jgi:hypothetical protein
MALGIAAVAPPGAPELIMTPGEIRTRYLDLEADPAASDLQDLEVPAPAPGPTPVPPLADKTMYLNKRVRKRRLS